MIGWTGVPLDPRILADGYCDADGNWIEDYASPDYSSDSDADGIPDYEESHVYGTNPYLADTDGDGVSDYDEIFFYLTSPTVPYSGAVDSDGDGLPDTDEIDFYGTNPYSADTDADGMSDYEEITLFFTNPTVSDTPGGGTNPVDSDGDGLTDDEESGYGTNPFSNDSDGDGYSDHDEIHFYFTNPTDSSSYGGSSTSDPYGSGDADGDGLSDYDEVYYRSTDPYLADTDGDGLTDYQEIYGISITTYVEYTSTSSMDEGNGNMTSYDSTYTDSYSTTEYPDPRDPDTDNDLLPDGYEYLQGLNPVNSGDGQNDADSDGLTWGQEYVLGTNHLVADTDGDGHTDGNEVLAGTDPLDPASPPAPESESGPAPDSGGSGSGGGGSDTSNPGRSNPGGTDAEPNGNALTPDWLAWRAQHFADLLAVDPADPRTDGEEDPDDDTLTNIEEFLLGTDPLNPDSDQDGLLDGREVAGLVLHYDRTETPAPSYSPAPGESGYHGFVYGPYEFRHSTAIYDDDYNVEIGLIVTWMRSVGTYDRIWGLTSTNLEYLDRTGYYNHQGTLVFPGDGWVVDEVGHLVPDARSSSPSTDPSEPTWNEVFDDTLQMWVGTSSSGRITSTWWWVHTDPLDADSDGDGMPDGWEYENWLHPKKASDSTVDQENDMLTNLVEYLHGTDPWTQDTDADTLSDGHEVTVSLTDPLDPADPGAANGSETAVPGGGSTIVSRYQTFGGGTGSGTTGTLGTGGLSLRSQHPRFGNNLQPSRAPQKKSDRPTRDDELYLETRNLGLGYGPNYEEGPLVEEGDGAGDGYWEDRVDPETNEIIPVWIPTGGVYVPQDSSEQAEPPKYSASTSWKANGQFQSEESEAYDQASAAKAYLQGKAIPPDTDWNADLARAYLSGADARTSTDEEEVDGRIIRWGGGVQMEVRLVRKDGSGANASYLTVERDIEKTFLKVMKSRPSPFNPSDEWTIEPGVEVVTLKIQEGDSMSVEDGENPVDDAVLKPEIKDGRITSESLLPVDLKVDYDRDGEDDILGDAGDTIPQDERFRFWINDDNDEGNDAAALDEKIGNDSSDGRIDSLRDLEDFTRLHIDLSSLSSKLKTTICESA